MIELIIYTGLATIFTSLLLTQAQELLRLPRQHPHHDNIESPKTSENTDTPKAKVSPVGATVKSPAAARLKGAVGAVNALLSPRAAPSGPSATPRAKFKHKRGGKEVELKVKTSSLSVDSQPLISPTPSGVLERGRSPV